MALVLDAAALPLLADGLTVGSGSIPHTSANTGGTATSSSGGNRRDSVVIQEFANHSGLQYKVYAVGEQVSRV